MRDTSEYLLDELRESHDSSYTIQEIFSQKYDIMIRYLWSRIYEEMNTLKQIYNRRLKDQKPVIEAFDPSGGDYKSV